MSRTSFWPLTTDCLVLQLNVYFTAQAVYKAFEGLFGGVKVLPGAFCLLRYTAVESCCLLMMTSKQPMSWNWGKTAS